VCRPVGLLLEGPAGYSDLAVGPEAVHVLVETGDERPHERLDLITIDLPTALRAVGDPKEQHP
jgi:sialidase-1